jgi:hypothetical protein
MKGIFRLWKNRKTKRMSIMVFIYMFSRGNDLCEIVLVGTQKQGVRRIIKTFETKITIIRKYQFTKNSISKIS